MKRTGQPLGLKKRKNRQHAPNLDADDLAMQCEAAPYRLDDRFHETGIDEPSIHGTRSVLADSSFENG
jgi:hypothetical protein